MGKPHLLKDCDKRRLPLSENSRRFWAPPPTNLLPRYPPSTPLGQMLPLRNQTLMYRTGEQGDAVSADLIAEVLAGHTDPLGAGRTQDIHAQVRPFLNGFRVSRASSGHRSQESTPVLVRALSCVCDCPCFAKWGIVCAKTDLLPSWK